MRSCNPSSIAGCRSSSSTAHHATAHLIAHGHHRIGFLGDRPNLYTADERQRGYVRALHEAGLPADSDVQWRGQAEAAPAAAAAAAMLDLPNPPTGIFSGNNLATVGVLAE